MKITKEELQQIIKEELEAALEEGIMDRIPKFKFGTDSDKPFASYTPGSPKQKPLTNAEYNAMRRQKKADHDARSQKIGLKKAKVREARKAERRKQMGITEEEILHILKEMSGKSFSYNVLEDEFDGGPTVEFEGIDITFDDMINSLVGKQLDFDDGEGPFKFSLEPFGGEPWNLVQHGLAADFVEKWAELNGYEATRTGAYYQ